VKAQGSSVHFDYALRSNFGREERISPDGVREWSPARVSPIRVCGSGVA